MDPAMFAAPAATILVAVVGSYVAMKNASNDRFTDLSVQIAELGATMTALKEEVEKHNGVVERTYKLESDMNTAFKRIDELKESDIRLEGKIERG